MIRRLTARLSGHGGERRSAPPERPTGATVAAPEESERRARRALFKSLAASTPFVVVETPVGRFLVSTSDRSKGRHLFVHRDEPEAEVLGLALEVLRLVGRPVRPGLFVEVGGNIGTTTVTALHRPEFQRAVVCEPAPTNVELLQVNVLLNALSGRATIVPEAVGDRVGAVTFALDAMSTGHAVAAATTRPGDAGCVGLIEVPLTTLDALAERGLIHPGGIAMLWLDVEGYEPAVLRGAVGVLASAPPVVLEIQPRKLPVVSSIEALVASVPLNYSHFVDLRRAVNDGIRDVLPISELPDFVGRLTRTTDILLVPDEQPEA